METIQLQCGNCKNMMAISTEHLGAQVQCPHCQAVLQTPPKRATGVQAPAPEQPLPTFRNPDRESIFADPEPVDDLFGGPPTGARVELPQSAVAAKNPAPPRAPSMTDAFASAHEGHHEDDGYQANPQPVRTSASSGGSPFVIYLLIGLISYSICTTAMIAYLLMHWPSVNAFDFLPDPNVKGAAKQAKVKVQHDGDLPSKNIVALNESVTIGDVNVVPTKVSMTREGNFVLHLRIKNVSPNTHFTPISDSFLKVNDQIRTSYTYLENPEQRLYGGFLEVKRITGKDEEGELYPNEEGLFMVITPDKMQKVTKRLANLKSETMVWRVQVRRGLIDFRGGRISATAVIGVRFTPNAIERDA